MRHEQQINDPSFGQIRLGRVSGSRGRLYGSTVDSPEHISISIHPSTLYRDEGEDRYVAKNQPIVEVLLTPNQFAEFITSSYTSGVPCTIRSRDGEGIPLPDFENERTKMDDEFARTMQNIARKVDRLTETSRELLEKKSLTKADRETIRNQIQAATSELRSHFPTISMLYNEQLDKATVESKANVTSFVESTVRSLGLQSLSELTDLRQQLEHGHLKQLTHPDTDTVEHDDSADN